MDIVNSRVIVSPTGTTPGKKGAAILITTFGVTTICAASGKTQVWPAGTLVAFELPSVKVAWQAFATGGQTPQNTTPLARVRRCDAGPDAPATHARSPPHLLSIGPVYRHDGHSTIALSRA